MGEASFIVRRIASFAQIIDRFAIEPDEHQGADALHASIDALGRKCLYGQRLSHPRAKQFHDAAGELVSIYKNHTRIRQLSFCGRSVSFERKQEDPDGSRDSSAAANIGTTNPAAVWILKQSSVYNICAAFAKVAELADAPDLGSGG